ncbi:hypothetical protein [Pontibacter harenae]|uniref:hypothetical protein n=1 Tax=Pontibacter harenae TaxID=2894083 RepID=UPI001E488CA7|nr:hypothetical protein [Pontibacter harenae]MCC9165476.1 hypothetical protein [Pontibacter harenae]
MKNITHKYFILYLSVICGLMLFGCDKDEAPDFVNSTPSSMTAVVNGADWKATSGNYKLGTRVINNGASAFLGSSDTLTIIGVQVQGTDTTAIVLSVKLTTDRVGSYRFRSNATSNGNAYFVHGFSTAALQETKEKYNGGITNGELRITQYDAANYRVTGDFAFSMSASGETTYTAVAGKIQNVTF